MKKYLSFVLALVLVLTSIAFTASADEIKDLRAFQTTANEMETFCYQYSQKAQDLNVLSNCYDHLLTNDINGTLAPNIAKEWSSPDGGQTWIFKLNEGVTWVDYQGNYMADCTAEDWVTGLEWVLNYAKNQSANTSMPIQMIQGAKDYYDYTKAMFDEGHVDEAKALGTEKFLEMVGVSAPDATTITFTCIDKLAYFPSLACYNCLAPLSAKLIEKVGVDGYFGADYTTIWYNGPYTITYYSHQNEKVLTKNESYWNKDNVKLFDTVTIKMVDGRDVAFQMFQNGELDYVDQLTPSQISILTSESHEFHNNMVPMRATKYSYNWKWNYAKNNEDGTLDTNWNLAVANENFRQSIYWGLSMMPYFETVNMTAPLSCQNFCYTYPGLVAQSDGTEYTALVRKEMGLEYSDESYARYDAAKAADYKAKAIEELTAQGVTFPVELDWYIAGSSTVAKDTADALTQMFNDCLGEDYIKFTTKTYVTSYMSEVVRPRLHSIWSSGWGADFSDPINFLGQEIADDDNAYYAVNYSFVNDITDETLKAQYAEFTKLVKDADAITDDLDARYAAFAKAEAYMLEHALAVPTYFNKGMELTCINDYSKIFSLYGNQSERYVNWETDDAIYTVEDYTEFAK